MITLKKIQLDENKTNGSYDLIIGFSNNKYQLINISPASTPAQIAQNLEELAGNILKEVDLKS